jgi:hypothetical protein
MLILKALMNLGIACECVLISTTLVLSLIYTKLHSIFLQSEMTLFYTFYYVLSYFCENILL